MFYYLYTYQGPLSLNLIQTTTRNFFSFFEVACYFKLVGSIFSNMKSRKTEEHFLLCLTRCPQETIS